MARQQDALFERHFERLSLIDDQKHTSGIRGLGRIFKSENWKKRENTLKRQQIRKPKICSPPVTCAHQNMLHVVA